ARCRRLSGRFSAPLALPEARTSASSRTSMTIARLSATAFTASAGLGAAAPPFMELKRLNMGSLRGLEGGCGFRCETDSRSENYIQDVACVIFDRMAKECRPSPSLLFVLHFALETRHKGTMFPPTAIWAPGETWPNRSS